MFINSRDTIGKVANKKKHKAFLEIIDFKIQILWMGLLERGLPNLKGLGQYIKIATMLV